MINLETINKDILELETLHDTTWNVVERLSWLYTVRDHLQVDNNLNIQEEVIFPGDSEFLNSIKGKDLKNIMMIIDELMSTIYVIQPNLYKSVIRRITD